MVMGKHRNSDTARLRRQSVSSTGEKTLKVDKNAALTSKSADNGEEVYRNPTTTQLVESRYPVTRAYVVDENAPVYEYAQVKGKNAQVMIMFTELGLAIYPAKLKKKSKEDLDKVDPQSFYPYSEMRGINHCRGKKGNYLSLKSADGETCAFFSKETDDIKTSLVAYIRSCSDMLFGTYDNNYMPGKQGIPLDDPLHPNAPTPQINPNMAPQYFPPGDPERQGFNDAQRRSFIAQNRQGFSDAQRRSFNSKNASRSTIKKDVPPPPSMPSLRRASAIFGSMDALKLGSGPMPGQPIVNQGTMYARQPQNYSNRRSMGSMDELSQIHGGMGGSIYNPHGHPPMQYGDGGRSLDDFSHGVGVGGPMPMGGPVPMGGPMPIGRQSSGQSTPEYMPQNAFEYSGPHNNQPGIRRSNSRPMGSFGGPSQGAPMNRQTVRQPISNGFRNRATMINRQAEPQQRQMRRKSMDAMQVNAYNDQNGMFPGVARGGGTPARRPSNAANPSRISPRQPDNYQQNFGRSPGALPQQRPKSQAPMRAPDNGPPQQVSPFSDTLSMQVPQQHLSKAPSPAPRPAPRANQRPNTTSGMGEPHNLQEANQGVQHAADKGESMNFSAMEGALNGDENAHNPFYDQDDGGDDNALKSKYSAVRTVNGQQADPFTAF